jgi:hypothetical protein
VRLAPRVLRRGLLCRQQGRRRGRRVRHDRLGASFPGGLECREREDEDRERSAGVRSFRFC